MSGRQAKAARRALDETLDALWARVPNAGCQGLCADACGPIGMSEVERDRIRRRHGVVIEDAATAPGTLDCPALVGGRCSVYADRPMVCRVWGVIDPLPCPHGCLPLGGRLSDAAGAELMRAALALDGPGRTVVDPGVLERVAADQA